MNVDKLFNAINRLDTYKIVKYNARETLSSLIYTCLKYRYGYQIGILQEYDLVRDIEWFILSYGYNDYKYYLDRIEFFHEGEELEKIYLEVVHFMEKYQGYKDLPKDLAHLFTFENINKGVEGNDRRNSYFYTEWLYKYARGKRIKEHLRIV